MLKFFRFLFEQNSLLLFLIMEIFAFFLIINNNLYVKYKNHDWVTEISGNYYSKIYNIKRYMDLKDVNNRLLEENAQLRKQVLDKNKENNLVNTWKNYTIIPAIIITNQYQLYNNVIILNKGSNAGIEPEEAVVGDKGIIGFTIHVSPNYSAVLSVLNKKNMISVQPKCTHQMGFIKWNGQNPHILNVIDLPFEAKIKLNDTIVTSGNSNIFPKGLPVGRIIKIKKLTHSKTYDIQIETFEDLTNLNIAYVLKNHLSKEYQALKDSINEF